MCRIGLTLTTTVESGLSITSANGRYRLQGTSTWITFSINLSDPKTPDINNVGFYELQVNVTDSSGSVSDWSPNTPTIFEISENCSGVVIITPQCNEWIVTNRSFSEEATFTYIDCKNPLGGNLVLGPRTGDNICSVITQTIIDDNPNFIFANIGVGDCQ